MIIATIEGTIQDVANTLVPYKIQGPSPALLTIGGADDQKFEFPFDHVLWDKLDGLMRAALRSGGS